MRCPRWLLAWVVACALGGPEARAHFLFIKIGPVAEGGRSAEVYFSEQAEAGDPRFIAKVAQTKLWAQSKPGEFLPLDVRQGADRLRAALPGTASVAVVGVCEYGVLARPNQTPFLLRYYPKAMAGSPDALNRMSPRSEIPLEIMATLEGSRLRLVTLRRGQPVPGMVFHTVDSDLTNEEITAGPDGAASWTPPAPGRYSVYVRDTIKQAGEHGGTRYDEIREFATLAFSWPLERTGADPEAVALFEEALATRAQWSGFPGFSAEVSGELDGRPFAGTATVRADGTVEVQVDDPVARPWLQDQLESIAMHRRAESDGGKASDQPKPVLRFADDRDDHPLGRLLVFEGGRFASSYRVKDRQIMVVNRTIGPRNMTITVLDNDRNPDGRFLPHSYLVHYWNAKSGALDHVETVQERWERVGSWDLPASHLVTTTATAGLSIRSATLTKHRLLEKGR
jgi:hypothetical protein